MVFPKEFPTGSGLRYAIWKDAGDPVIGNPFPPDNPRHAFWKDATLRAEEEHHRHNTQAMQDRPTREGFQACFERGGNLREFAKWVLNLHATRFDIWAKRGCPVVLDENDLRAYDSWLSTYAQDYLNLVASSGTVRDWPTGTCPIPVEFQSTLTERVNYWKAEARRFLCCYRDEVKKNKLTEQADGKRAEPSPAENSDKTAQGVESKSASAAPGNAREAFIRPILDKKGFTVHGWANQADVDFHTADNYLKGATKPYPDTLRKLADALGVKLEELPT